MSFSETLKLFLGRCRMTQTALAEQIGVSRSFVSKMVSGQRSPTDREQVLALARGMSLGPAQTDELLEAAGYLPESLFDITGLDAHDHRLRALLHSLADIRSTGEAKQAETVLDALVLFVQGAREGTLLPTIATPAPPPKTTQLTSDEAEVDDVLTLILTGDADSDQASLVEKALEEGPLAWELRRRIAEALPPIAQIDAQAALRIAHALRDDYDPDKFLTDVRRRVVEAVPALHELAGPDTLELIEPLRDDQVYVAIATIEAMHSIEMSPHEMARIRHKLIEFERPEHSGVVSFLAGLLDMIADGRANEAISAMKTARERDRVFRICVARNAQRLFPICPVEALWLMLHFLRQVEGVPAEHANVRRPAAIAIPKLIEMLSKDTPESTLARVVIYTLVQETDLLIRRAVADDLGRLAEVDPQLARELITNYLTGDSDPYIRRRAWQGLMVLGES